MGAVAWLATVVVPGRRRLPRGRSRAGDRRLRGDRGAAAVAPASPGQALRVAPRPRRSWTGRHERATLERRPAQGRPGPTAAPPRGRRPAWPPAPPSPGGPRGPAEPHAQRVPRRRPRRGGGPGRGATTARALPALPDEPLTRRLGHHPAHRGVGRPHHAVPARRRPRSGPGTAASSTSTTVGAGRWPTTRPVMRRVVAVGARRGARRARRHRRRPRGHRHRLADRLRRRGVPGQGRPALPGAGHRAVVLPRRRRGAAGRGHLPLRVPRHHRRARGWPPSWPPTTAWPPTTSTSAATSTATGCADAARPAERTGVCFFARRSTPRRAFDLGVAGARACSPAAARTWTSTCSATRSAACRSAPSTTGS